MTCALRRSTGVGEECRPISSTRGIQPRQLRRDAMADASLVPNEEDEWDTDVLRKSAAALAVLLGWLTSKGILREGFAFVRAGYVAWSSPLMMPGSLSYPCYHTSPNGMPLWRRLVAMFIATRAAMADVVRCPPFLPAISHTPNDTCAAPFCAGIGQAHVAPQRRRWIAVGVLRPTARCRAGGDASSSRFFSLLGSPGW
jgi:hypothetical protein